MSHLTATASPGVASPLPLRESRLTLALHRLRTWLEHAGLFRSRAPAEGTRSEPRDTGSIGARPLMAAAWYGSLGPGPLCLPGHPAMRFEPGYRD
jgi:hypothetical protein